MTARDRLRAWDVNLFRSSNLTHKSCGIFVASWGFAHGIGTRLVFHIFFYLTVRRTNGAMQKNHKVLKMRLLIFTFAAFLRGSLEPQRLLIQIWRSSVTDACKPPWPPLEQGESSTSGGSLVKKHLGPKRIWCLVHNQPTNACKQSDKW